MIMGAHAIVYSRKPEADRAFFRDTLHLRHVDAGDGWLIFALPHGELAVHPARRNNVHELYLLVPDVDAFVGRMRRDGRKCGAVHALSWGRLTQVRLPGGGKIGVYEPRHARPKGSRSRGGRARARQGQAA
jgi:hypothetical protein